MKLATNATLAPAPASAGSMTNELRDIKPPVEISDGLIWLWWLVALLAMAAMAGWLWHRNRSRKPLPRAQPVEPAHVRAKRELERALGLIDQPREFCIRVSDIARWYLEERFDFRAPERTTEEFLNELHGTTLLDPAQKSSLGGFLQKCDLVKFARYQPGEPELRDLHESALRLVLETAPAEPPDHVSKATHP